MVRAVPSGKRGVKKIVPSRGEGTANIPIVRDKWATDELAAKQLRKDAKKVRKAPKQGKPGTFNPVGDAAKFK